MAPGIDPDDVVHPRQRQVREAGIGGRDAPAPGPRQYLPRRLLDRRVVAVARQEQQDGDEAVEGVAAREQPHARAVAKMHDALGDAQKVLGAHLEQLVAGVVGEHVFQALVVMGSWRQPRARQHLLDLAPDQGDRGGRLVIGLGGEQADEADLAVRPSVRAVPLDADVIHRAAPVHPRAQVGLGHHQRGVAEIAA